MSYVIARAALPADYPADADVRDGVPFDGGQRTGTLRGVFGVDTAGGSFGGQDGGEIYFNDFGWRLEDGVLDLSSVNMDEGDAPYYLMGMRDLVTLKFSETPQPKVRALLCWVHDNLVEVRNFASLTGFGGGGIAYCEKLETLPALPPLEGDWWGAIEFQYCKYSAETLEAIVDAVTGPPSTLVISSQVTNGGDYPNADTLAKIADLADAGWTVFYDEEP